MGKIIGVLMILFMTIMGLTFINGVGSNIDTADTPASTHLLVSVAPIVIALGAIIAMLGILMGGQIVYRYYKWSAFGNRLKAAYEAKFGYANPEFNKEVDAHTQTMRALGKGYTKEVHEEWLKRMAKFVEVPWAIPSEEYISETQKTDQFDNTNK